LNVLEIPLETGGALRVEMDRKDLPAELDLAASQPGKVIGRASESLEHSLERLQPAIVAISERMRAGGADSFVIEFGLTMAAEAGLVVAKGSSEMHFTVTLSWSAHRER
jgi:hypothetical protein